MSSTAIAHAVPSAHPARLASLANMAPPMPVAWPTPQRLPAGQVLFNGQDRFRHLYTVRSGALKACRSLPDGRQQVCSFHMPGDVLGLEGIADGLHHNDVIALEDSHVHALSASMQDSELRRQLSLELRRSHWHLLLLGQLTARERVGAFVLDLSQRASARGQSASHLLLSMSRTDIGSYLGMTLETVSRALSHFKEEGWMQVNNRQVVINHLPRFTRMFELRSEF
jgi:CRP/FNR family transcriptional regulator